MGRGEVLQTGVLGKKAGWEKKRRRFGIKRGPWLTVGGVVVVLAVLATLGYVWGLGPMNRLNAERGSRRRRSSVGLTGSPIRTFATSFS